MMKLTKKQQTSAREENILLCARKTIAQRGLIGLKMPELAKDAVISIGTLYRHFESREDLIGALAQQALATRTNKLRKAISLFEDPLQKLISVALLDFIFNIKHSEAFHIEASCTNANIWHLASDSRQQNYKKEGEQLSVLLASIIEQAAPHSHKQNAVIGLWGLVTGLSYVWYNTMPTGNLSQALSFYRPQLTNFFSGSFAQLAVKDADIDCVEKHLLENSESWIWKMEINENA